MYGLWTDNEKNKMVFNRLIITATWAAAKASKGASLENVCKMQFTESFKKLASLNSQNFQNEFSPIQSVIDYEKMYKWNFQICKYMNNTTIFLSFSLLSFYSGIISKFILQVQRNSIKVSDLLRVQFHLVFLKIF